MLLLAVLVMLVTVVMAVTAHAADLPLKLHPDNPHYFLFRGQPTVLITSAEHYGAVLNLDFDYRKYLDTLQRDGMNHTRLFVGPYCESATSFNITRNTLAPAAGRLACAWARSDQPGYANGGNRFDLTRWDEAYFARLKDFIAQASRCGVVVEVNLFCPFYGDEQWHLSPLNAGNNINGLGQVSRTDAYTLEKHGGLMAVQEQMVRRVVTELQSFDNLYYEIMNEPYICNVPADWERHIAAVIAQTEGSFAHRHLISQNIANGKADVKDPDPNVSILNFHYAFPPETVGANYGLNVVIGDNETGFAGTSDARYRMEGWAFVLAGGGLYNNLDYSFTVGHEDGSFQYPDKQPGGGSKELRGQLRVLADFMRGLDFLRMHPAPEVVTGLPAGVRAQALAEPGKQVACYVYRDNAATPPGAAQLRLQLPAGAYRGEWVDPVTGQKQNVSVQSTGEATLATPAFVQDLALRLGSP